MNNEIFKIIQENVSEEWKLYLIIVTIIFLIIRQLKIFIFDYKDITYSFRKNKLSKYNDQIELIKDGNLRKKFIELNDRHIACRFAKTNNYPLALKIITFMNSPQNEFSKNDFNYYLRFFEIKQENLILRKRKKMETFDNCISISMFSLSLVFSIICLIIFCSALFLQIQYQSTPLPILIMSPILSMTLLFVSIAIQTGIPKLSPEKAQKMVALFNESLLPPTTSTPTRAAAVLEHAV